MKDLTSKKKTAVLVLEMSYTPAMYRTMGNVKALQVHTVSNFFDRAIVCHPFADIPDGNIISNNIDLIRIAPRVIFISGKSGTQETRWKPLGFIFSQIKLILYLIRLSRRYNFQAIKIGDPYYLGMLGVILKFALRIPLVIRVCFRYSALAKANQGASFPRLFRFRLIEKIIENVVFKLVDFGIGANLDNLEYAHENGLPRSRGIVVRYTGLIEEIHFTTPSMRDTPDPINGLDPEKPFIITISRLEKVKLLDDLIMAFFEITKELPDIKLVLIGDGTQRQHLESLAAKLNISQNVIFAGTLSQNSIGKLLPRARLALATHMGRALVESALAELPLVGYDYDWQREIIINGETGSLVRNGDYKGLAHSALDILECATAQRVLGERSRTYVLEEFSSQQNLEREIRLFKKLVALE